MSAAAEHCRMSCSCCGEVLFALKSAPPKQLSSIAEPAVAAVNGILQRLERIAAA